VECSAEGLIARLRIAHATIAQFGESTCLVNRGLRVRFLLVALYNKRGGECQWSTERVL
jgi:hypothetical protein